MGFHTASVVKKSLFSAYSMLAADVAGTPGAVALAASQMIGRKATGGVVALTASDIKTILGAGVASGLATLGATTKVVEQPASITDHLDGSPDEDDATKAPTSEWAFDHNAAATGVHGVGSDYLAKVKTAQAYAFKGDGSQSLVNLLENGDFEVGDPPTGWALSGADAVWARSDTQVKTGTYSCSLTRNGTNCYIYQSVANYAYYKGRKVTFGCLVYATVASRARLNIYDGVDSVYSSYHTGDAGWEWLTVTHTVNANANRLREACRVEGGDTTAYLDGAILVEGDSCPAFSDKPINTYDAIILRRKLTAGAVEIEGSNFDIDGCNISAGTISGDLTWGSAQTGVTLTAPTLNGTTTLGAVPIFDAGSGSVQINTTGGGAGLTIQSTQDGATGARISCKTISTTPAQYDIVWDFTAVGRNTTPADYTYGATQIRIVDPTAGSEESEFLLYLRTGAGVWTLAQQITGDGISNMLTAYKVNGTQVVSAQGAAVADATDADSVILRLNELLARCRAHGLIAT